MLQTSSESLSFFFSFPGSTDLFQIYLPNQDCKCSCVLKQEQPSFQAVLFLTLLWPSLPSKFMPAHFLITSLTRLPSHCQYRSCTLILSYTCTSISNCSTGRYFSVCTCLQKSKPSLIKCHYNPALGRIQRD